MKYLVLVGALCCFLQIPAAANEGGQSIEGTWIAHVANNLFEVGSFSPDGSYTGANVNGLQSAHKGVWVRTGYNKYEMTVLFFTHDAAGTFNGIVKARLVLTLSEDANSYDSVAERTVMDTLGNVLSVTPGIPGHSDRMNVERQ